MAGWLATGGCFEPQGGAPTTRAGSAAAEGPSCRVRSITDGDTLVCEDGTRVRLLLIDTPEMDQGEFGRRARRALLELAPPGSRLGMELDVETTDRYGRTLAYLYDQEGRFVNEAMVRRGFAVTLTYPPNVKHVERMKRALEEAREARVGLWSTPAFDCLPVDHRAGRCESR